MGTAGSTGRRGPLAAALGRRRTSTSRPARSGPGCASRASGSSRSSGWAERGDGRARRPRQLGAALPHHLGHRPRRAWSRSSAGCASTSRDGRVDAAVPPPGRRAGASTGGAVDRGARARCSRPTTVERGRADQPRDDRRLRARRPGGDRHLRRHRRQPRPGPGELAGPARHARRGTMVAGVPAYVDGRMLGITEAAGGRRHQPRPDVALRRGPAQLGPDLGRTTASGSCPARRRCGSTRAGRRLPAPYFPGFDTLGTLGHLRATGHDHSWFVLTQKIIEKEFALSGSEQNPDLTGKERPAGARRGSRPGAPGRSRRSSEHGADFVVADTLAELVAGMNALTPEHAARRRPTCGGRSSARDREIDNPLLQGRPGHGDPRRPQLPRRQAHPGRRTAPDPRPRRRPADRGAAARPDPQDPRRPGDRPGWPGAACGRHGAARAVRRRRGHRVRRRRHARLPRAGGHLPRRLPLLRPCGRPAAAAAIA